MEELSVKQTSFMLQINAFPAKILIVLKFLLKFSFSPTEYLHLDLRFLYSKRKNRGVCFLQPNLLSTQPVSRFRFVPSQFYNLNGNRYCLQTAWCVLQFPGCVGEKVVD